MVRQCQDSFFRIDRGRACNTRSSAAQDLASDLMSTEQYAVDIDAAIDFLDGKNQSVVDTFVQRMEEASANQDYEQAARFRDQIAGLKK